jgi:hypothetical protein
VIAANLLSVRERGAHAVEDMCGGRPSKSVGCVLYMFIAVTWAVHVQATASSCSSVKGLLLCGLEGVEQADFLRLAELRVLQMLDCSAASLVLNLQSLRWLHLQGVRGQTAFPVLKVNTSQLFACCQTAHTCIC